MEQKPAHTDVAVVGGGVAGLSAACYLARAGLEVIVFEKAPSLGGRAATKESDGFMFNRGIHALYTGGAASRTLEELGIAYGHSTPKETFVLDGRELRSFPTSPSQFLRAPTCSAQGTRWRSSAFSPRWGGSNRTNWPGRACKNGWT